MSWLWTCRVVCMRDSASPEWQIFVLEEPLGHLVCFPPTGCAGWEQVAVEQRGMWLWSGAGQGDGGVCRVLCGTWDNSLERSIRRKRNGEGNSRKLCVELVPSLPLQGDREGTEIGWCRGMQDSAKIQTDLMSCKLSEIPSLKKKKKERRALERKNSSKHNVILQTNTFRNSILFGSNRVGKELKMQLMWNALNAHVKLPTHYPRVFNQGGLHLQKWLLTKLSGPIYCLGNCPYFVCFLFP